MGRLEAGMETQMVKGLPAGTAGLPHLTFSARWPKTLLLRWQSCRKVNKVSDEAQPSGMGTFLNRIGQKPQCSSEENLCLHDRLLLPSSFLVLLLFCFLQVLGNPPISVENVPGIIFQIQRVGRCTWKAITDIWRPMCRKQRQHFSRCHSNRNPSVNQQEHMFSMITA